MTHEFTSHTTLWKKIHHYGSKNKAQYYSLSTLYTIYFYKHNSETNYNYQTNKGLLQSMYSPATIIIYNIIIAYWKHKEEIHQPIMQKTTRN